MICQAVKTDGSAQARSFVIGRAFCQQKLLHGLLHPLFPAQHHLVTVWMLARQQDRLLLLGDLFRLLASAAPEIRAVEQLHE